MKTMIVSQHGSYLTVQKGLFVVREKGGGKKEVSPAEIDEILVISTAVISAKAIQLAITHGIDIFFIDSREEVWGKVMPSVATKTVTTRKMQYEVIVEGKGDLYGKEIITSKIYNQAAHLKFWSRYGYSTSDKELLNYNEATAARLYWQDLARVLPIPFPGRDPESADQFNLSLNYSYAILYNRILKYLTLVGLDPYLGFVHRDRSGKESLVYDFSEMFKPYIDLVLVRAFREGFRVKIKDGLLERDSRKGLASLITASLEEKVREVYDDHTKTLSQTIKSHAVRLAEAIRNKGNYRGFRIVL